MRAQLLHQRVLGPFIKELTFLCDTPLKWRAGQYIDISVEGHETKPYSIAGYSTDYEEGITVHIAANGQGRLSDYLAKDMREGDAVHIHGPFGQSVLSSHQAEPITYIAGGTGLAPVCAYIQALGSEDYHLYHAVKGRAEFYAPLLGLAATPIFSDQHEEKALNGFAHEILDFTGQGGRVFYLAGPPPMVQAVKAKLLHDGIDETRIFHD